MRQRLQPGLEAGQNRQITPQPADKGDSEELQHGGGLWALAKHKATRPPHPHPLLLQARMAANATDGRKPQGRQATSVLSRPPS
jgi:hypothetical protein